MNHFNFKCDIYMYMIEQDSFIVILITLALTGPPGTCRLPIWL